MDGWAFSHDVRVRFAETDAQGIAHHASFVVWLEEARVAYLAAFAGGYKAIRDRGIEALTTGVHVEYDRAAVFDDVLRIRVRCGEIRGARFRYEYVVERDGERVASGWTTHATVDAATHRPTRVPEWFVAELLRAEGRSALPRRDDSVSGSSVGGVAVSVRLGLRLRADAHDRRLARVERAPGRVVHQRSVRVVDRAPDARLSGRLPCRTRSCACPRRARVLDRA